MDLRPVVRLRQDQRGLPKLSDPRADDAAARASSAGVVARARARLAALAGLDADDPLRDRAFRRLWTSILIGSLGAQVTMLALPLTAAQVLHASPTQMGRIVAAEIAPFVLLSLPAGVVLDRVRRLPVWIGGEIAIGLAVASVPLAQWAGVLSIGWMMAVAFVIGCVHTVGGSAAQIVLTQIVPRERLVAAHARNALAGSMAEVLGPGFAGALIKAVGAPRALLLDAAMVGFSVAILAGLKVRETLAAARERWSVRAFGRELGHGLRFVAGQRLLVVAAAVVGVWQAANQAATVGQILFATRVLGLDEATIGLAFIGSGVGTLAASGVGSRVSRRLGPGPAMLLGVAITGVGWIVAALTPAARPWGAIGFALMLGCFGAGAVTLFVNFISIRQAATPDALLGRMTSTMRWLILLPAGPGALLGGWLGEHVGLRAPLAFAGLLALGAAAVAARGSRLRALRALPSRADAPAA